MSVGEEGPRNSGTPILFVLGASFLRLDSEKRPNILVIHSPIQSNRFKQISVISV